MGRDEKRASLKTPAWEAKERQASKKFYNKCSENSGSQIVFRTDILQKLTLGTTAALSPQSVTSSILFLTEKVHLSYTLQEPIPHLTNVTFNFLLFERAT